MPAGALPITPELGVYAGPLLRAALAGLLTTFVFALWPLAIARETSPASLFRALVGAVAALAAPALSRCCWRWRSPAWWRWRSWACRSPASAPGSC